MVVDEVALREKNFFENFRPDTGSNLGYTICQPTWLSD